MMHRNTRAINWLYVLGILAWLLVMSLHGTAVQAADVLASVNARRAYLGLPAFQHAPELQYWAELEAASGRNGHSYSLKKYRQIPARKAGVGPRGEADPTGRWVNFCYAVNTQHQYAAAAACVYTNRSGKRVTKYSIFLR